MSSFTRFDATLKVEYLLDESKNEGKDVWRVLEGFKYYLDDPTSDYAIVPHGFITDMASIPRLFWSWLPPTGQYGQAAVLHDYLCETALIQNSKEQTFYQISRKQADDILLEAMKVIGVNRFVSYVIYGAVRLWALTRQLSKKLSLSKMS